jgi:hypothetical protein
VVHVDGIFDWFLRQTTETAGRHAGYAAQYHKLTTESDAGNTPSGQEIEGVAVVCMRSARHLQFEGAKQRGVLLSQIFTKHIKVKEVLMATTKHQK